jgi:2-hydroxymuconate-semialdehyde hydrolase
MEPSPETGTLVDAGGIATNVHISGSGDPVLLIHGSGPGASAYANWRLTMPALAEQFRVIAPDLLGFGLSERPTDVDYGRELWVRHAVAVLDALGVEACHVVGNSYGGAIALGLAATHPERVHRLVLMGSVGVPFPITEGLDAVWGYQPSVDAMARLMRYFAYNTDLLSDDLARVRYEASVRPGVQEAYQRMFPPPRQLRVDEAALDDEALSGIAHETLIVHGRDDQVIPLVTSLRLLHLIDRSQLHVFARCGHWTQIEHADRFNRLVIDFLAEPPN